ncbi:MAG: alpha/beta hydrolase [Alphaproteobacteria bacterium]|nr:alpha/beta hydrolase [Alphaproteobacteria bacterium]
MSGIGAQPVDTRQGQGHLERPDGARIAYARRAGAAPTLVWLSGFNSDMSGTKATALDAWAAACGQGLVRFDYFGHGASTGRFEDGTIGRWRDDTLAVLDHLTDGPLVLVGSSMGAWMALLAARARPERLAGLLLIAPAPDFTEDLMWAAFSPATRQRLLREGRIERPSAYGEPPTPITLRLIEEGRDHLVLRGPLRVPCPVEILHGTADADVPVARSLALLEHLEAPALALTLVKGGDHRLSTPDDLARLEATLDRICGAVP